MAVRTEAEVSEVYIASHFTRVIKRVLVCISLKIKPVSVCINVRICYACFRACKSVNCYVRLEKRVLTDFRLPDICVLKFPAKRKRLFADIGNALRNYNALQRLAEGERVIADKLKPLVKYYGR